MKFVQSFNLPPPYIANINTPLPLPPYRYAGYRICFGVFGFKLHGQLICVYIIYLYRPALSRNTTRGGTRTRDRAVRVRRGHCERVPRRSSPPVLTAAAETQRDTTDREHAEQGRVVVLGEAARGRRRRRRRRGGRRCRRPKRPAAGGRLTTVRRSGLHPDPVGLAAGQFDD